MTSISFSLFSFKLGLEYYWISHIFFGFIDYPLIRFAFFFFFFFFFHITFENPFTLIFSFILLRIKLVCVSILWVIFLKNWVYILGNFPMSLEIGCNDKIILISCNKKISFPSYLTPDLFLKKKTPDLVFR
jgi:hypothetical protein